MTMSNEHRLDNAGRHRNLPLPTDFDESSATDEHASSSSALSSNKGFMRHANSGFTFPLNAGSSVPTKESADSNRIGNLDVLDEGEGPQLPVMPMTYEV
jgi:hypothetical protein